MNIFSLVNCAFDQYNLWSNVYFLRLSESLSGSIHDIYSERDESVKTYLKYKAKALVDENPRYNKKTKLGADEEVDLMLYFYSAKIEVELVEPLSLVTELKETFVPNLADWIWYRDVQYSITRVERLLPTEDSQNGFAIKARRFG